MSGQRRLTIIALVWTLGGGVLGLAVGLLLQAASAVAVPCTDAARAAGAAGGFPECEGTVSLTATASQFGLLGLLFAGLGVLVMPWMREDWAQTRAAVAAARASAAPAVARSGVWPEHGRPAYGWPNLR